MKKVWINGCFDVLHYGHLKLIEYAKSLGEVKIGIDSDKRVKELKGNDRPFHTQEQRLFNLIQLKDINNIVIFDSSKELSELIKEYSPDIFVIGDEYKDRKAIGGEFAKEIIYYPKIEGFSTTKLLENE